jgi:hypothetical protein
VYEEHPRSKAMKHDMAKSETSLFMMVLFVTTVMESLERNSKVIIKLASP